MEDFGLITISHDGTHHLIKDVPLYPQRYKKVLSFHKPGLAAVIDASGAYHIDLSGKPAYLRRFINTFGFYDEKASVIDASGAYHINPSGNGCYETRFKWTGNFQENVCVVSDFDDHYFHIMPDGNPLYPKNYDYVGDFKGGIAVVQNSLGKQTHIDKKGAYIHGNWFEKLDVFHKGYARAKTDNGWTHIDYNGKPLYKERYLDVEPFYNGVAIVERKSGEKALLRETGDLCKVFPGPEISSVALLSSDLVGYWKLWTLRTAIDLNLFKYLPNSLAHLAFKMGVPPQKLERLLRALWEMDILLPGQNELWETTIKGKAFLDGKENFILSAVYMWSCLNDAWKNLRGLISSASDKHHFSLKEKEPDPVLRDHFLRALDGYAENDLRDVALFMRNTNPKNIIGIGRSSLFILGSLLERSKTSCTFLIDDFTKNQIPKNLQKSEGFMCLNKTEILELQKKFDSVILTRYLHQYPDKEALEELALFKDCLMRGGRIYIIETLLKEDTPFAALLDLNMLAECGGKLRSLKNYQSLLANINLSIKKVYAFNNVTSMIEIVV